MKLDKVVFYLPEQQIDERVGHTAIRISRTKSEEILYPLRSKDSFTYKLLKTIAKDRILRQLFFSNYYLTYSFNQFYPVGIVFPIFLKSQEDFIKEVSEGRLREQVERIKQELERIRGEIDKLSFSLVSDFAISLISNPAFLQKLKRRKIPKEEEIQTVLKEIIKRNEERFMELVTKNLDAFGKIAHAMELSQLIRAIDFINMAQENYRILSWAIKLPDEIKHFYDSLTKLTSSGASVVSINSVCLDCKLRYDKDSVYSLSERNVSRVVNLRTECPNCGGSAVLHYLSVSGGEGLKGLILTHRLQEAIIALTLSELDQIQRVYVSKKVSAVVEGNVQRGLEIDVTAITEDDRLIIVEVSTTSREQNAVSNASRKLDNFSECRIPFDKYIYIAPIPIKEYLSIGKRGAYILSAKHLPKLEEFVKTICFND